MHAVFVFCFFCFFVVVLLDVCSTGLEVDVLMPVALIIMCRLKRLT